MCKKRDLERCVSVEYTVLQLFSLLFSILHCPSYSLIADIQGPHKLLDDFVRSYFELEMCHDIKIRVKYNTVNIHLERP
jgi:hypothetical protein